MNRHSHNYSQTIPPPPSDITGCDDKKVTRKSGQIILQLGRSTPLRREELLQLREAKDGLQQQAEMGRTAGTHPNSVVQDAEDGLGLVRPSATTVTQIVGVRHISKLVPDLRAADSQYENKSKGAPSQCT